jgi:hypothetical protein
MNKRVPAVAALIAVLSGCAVTPEELATTEPLRVYASSANAASAARCVAAVVENWGATAMTATVRQRSGAGSQEVSVRAWGAEPTLLVARVDAAGAGSRVALHLWKPYVFHEQMATAISDRCRTRLSRYSPRPVNASRSLS